MSATVDRIVFRYRSHEILENGMRFRVFHQIISTDCRLPTRDYRIQLWLNTSPCLFAWDPGHQQLVIICELVAKHVLHREINSRLNRGTAPVFWHGANLGREEYDGDFWASRKFLPYKIFNFILVEPLLMPQTLTLPPSFFAAGHDTLRRKL